MEPLSFVLVALSALAALATKTLVTRISALRSDISRNLEITTANGEKLTIEASKLTREKAEEIAAHSAAHAAF